MVVLRELSRRAKQIVGPVLGVALFGYFAYHLVEGDRGLLAWRQLTDELRAEKTRLAGLQAQREALARRTDNLKPDHLDRDLLDERVRASLELAAPNEVVILEKPAAH
jgi:cell division protein FtsB